MRIERHQVDQSAVSTAREDFVNRIGRMVHSYSRAGLMTATEWRLITDEFLDYLGALSAESPALDTPEAKAVLKDATEAAAGAISFAAYYSYDSFQVFLDYPNFGMSYDPDDAEEGFRRRTVLPQHWLDALCLAILSDKVSRHGEAFAFTWQAMPAGGGYSAAQLANGFMAHLFGDTRDGDAEDAPAADTPEQRLAAIDTALEQIEDRDSEATLALHTLRALAAEDREAFDTGLHSLLDRTGGALPRSLLPLLPLALAALAHRTHGWLPAVDTDYLPRTVITGFPTSGPRVAALGRDRLPEAAARLAAGPFHVDRPTPALPIHPDSEALYERATREAVNPGPDDRHTVSRLARALSKQALLFQARASQSADVTDTQLAGLRLASQLGAALFRTALAEPGTEAEVTIDGRTVRYPATRGEDTGPGHWQLALELALISGAREDLAPIVLAGPTHSTADRSAFASYRVALHDYFRGVDPLPATEQALRDLKRAEDWGFAPPPVVLFSQLVEGDETSFNLALVDALEAHRDHHSVADRATDSDAALNLEILALACHARRRGWTIHVDSPYLPARLLA
ncbi:immunity 49 family protein [Streptomyces sp. 1331.2]|uniref:immunity 49 family protein n=1 Tax=Streptomyces sp. 1331.2 TaxID=1938835 RepID=UPI000BC7E06B|nr:immunity 49 family protein [Streptomyces sp. 1331.2]SOB83954.1 Immunity protein 49 [Streptomyces sp. 1331.2]